jgi:hypothetical protein
MARVVRAVVKGVGLRESREIDERQPEKGRGDGCEDSR